MQRALLTILRLVSDLAFPRVSQRQRMSSVWRRHSILKVRGRQTVKRLCFRNSGCLSSAVRSAPISYGKHHKFNLCGKMPVQRGRHAPPESRNSEQSSVYHHSPLNQPHTNSRAISWGAEVTGCLVGFHHPPKTFGTLSKLAGCGSIIHLPPPARMPMMFMVFSGEGCRQSVGADA